LGRLLLRVTNEDLGSDEEYSRAQFLLNGFKSYGSHTLSAGVEWGKYVSGHAPLHDPFKLGGPYRLSGLYLDQLTGNKYNLVRLGYSYQFSSLPSQLGRGIYLNLSLEAGRIDDPLMKTPWGWVKSGGIYLGADTVLGTMAIGFGISSIDQNTLYLVIGPTF
jgi:NTE family protein